jgi:hypothetical protein
MSKQELKSLLIAKSCMCGNEFTLPTRSCIECTSKWTKYYPKLYRSIRLNRRGSSARTKCAHIYFFHNSDCDDKPCDWYPCPLPFDDKTKAKLQRDCKLPNWTRAFATDNNGNYVEDDNGKYVLDGTIENPTTIYPIQ